MTAVNCNQQHHAYYLKAYNVFFPPARLMSAAHLRAMAVSGLMPA
jgi:hypothetical protein